MISSDYASVVSHVEREGLCSMFKVGECFGQSPEACNPTVEHLGKFIRSMGSVASGDKYLWYLGCGGRYSGNCTMEFSNGTNGNL